MNLTPPARRVATAAAVFLLSEAAFGQSDAAAGAAKDADATVTASGLVF